jgi:hypothetical protein
MITVEFSDFSKGRYEDEAEAESAILEAHAEGVFTEHVENEDTGQLYSLLWGVKLQEES